MIIQFLYSAPQSRDPLRALVCYLTQEKSVIEEQGGRKITKKAITIYKIRYR